MTVRAMGALASAIAVATAVAVGPAAGATYPVDDGATTPLESAAVLRWREVAPSKSNDNTIEGAVAVRLNLAPWINRNGRLFLVLPSAGRRPSR